ncbi:hypothetical protein BGX26_011558 [Mortierella sp. AD094]|nr:hypothetical protein BGX26_011558 [Mortierella sp. AD094]
MELFQRAASQGSTDAKSDIGYMYQNGYGMTQDHSKAVEWYVKAANQGNADAQNNLGSIYRNGYGLTQDYSKAVEWYQKAASQGYAKAQHNLGIMYYNGEGKTNDISKATEWWKKAAVQGSTDARRKLDSVQQIDERSKKSGIPPSQKKYLPLASIVAAAVAAVPAAMYVSSKLSIPQDLKLLSCAVKSKKAFDEYAKNDTLNNTFHFDQNYYKNPDRVGLVFEGKSYTYCEIYHASNRIGHWLLSKGVKRGDIISLFMLNNPEFIFCWLGINRIGCTAAFINTNLRGKPLAHSLRIATGSILIMDSDLAAPVAHSLDEIIEMGYSIYWYAGTGDVDFAAPLDLSHVTEADTPDHLRRNTTLTDVAMLVYTSGTTGMPKAGKVIHTRVVGGGAFCQNYFGITENDRIYVQLPLYHSAAAILGIYLAWTAGATIILARKFSATHFFEDCRANGVTVIQYIGEICRYLINTPESPLDKKHSIRLAHGNGMRPDVWTRFKERFKIPVIAEWYASTEGTGSLINFNTGPYGEGAVGRRGLLLRMLDKGAKIVKFDIESESLIRDKNGRCIECLPGERGELLTIIDTSIPGLGFSGYHGDPEATSRKIAMDVFKVDDLYFRTGDILSMDADGLYYFGDRIGDTFRWKSENVSTTEVSEVLSAYPDCIEVNVYGVRIPGHDGRAGMAAISPKESMSWDKFAEYALRNLPRYAVPIFIRKVKYMETTGTFKQLKVRLVTDGIDPVWIKDEMFWLDGNRYKPFGKEEYERVIGGKARL